MAAATTATTYRRRRRPRCPLDITPPPPSQEDSATVNLVELHERATGENEAREGGENNKDALHGKTSRIV
jgi:hypothetical protein